MFEKFEIERNSFIEKIKSFVKRIKDNFNKLKTDKFQVINQKKLVAITIVMIALIGLTSITGFTVMVLNKRAKTISSLELQLNFCNTTLRDCENTRTQLSNNLSRCEDKNKDLDTNLNKCNTERETYKTDLDTCTQEKGDLYTNLKSCESDLETCNTDLKNLEEEHESLQTSYEKLSYNYAKDKCCPVYQYFTISEKNQILCCYKIEEKYICGAGEELTPDKIRMLDCL